VHHFIVQNGTNPIGFHLEIVETQKREGNERKRLSLAL